MRMMWVFAEWKKVKVAEDNIMHLLNAAENKVEAPAAGTDWSIMTLRDRPSARRGQSVLVWARLAAGKLERWVE